MEVAMTYYKEVSIGYHNKRNMPIRLTRKDHQQEREVQHHQQQFLQWIQWIDPNFHYRSRCSYP
jgi:hypothetical protein